MGSAQHPHDDNAHVSATSRLAALAARVSRQESSRSTVANAQARYRATDLSSKDRGVRAVRLYFGPYGRLPNTEVALSSNIQSVEPTLELQFFMPS
jgi:hypothetical protein